MTPAELIKDILSIIGFIAIMFALGIGLGELLIRYNERKR